MGKGATLLLPLALVACSGRTEIDGEAGTPPALFIRKVLALEPGECIAKPDPMAVSWLTGVLDVALRTRYDAAILVGNTLPADYESVVLERAQVSVRDRDGVVAVTKDVATGGFVESQGAELGGWGVALVTLLEAADIAALVPASETQNGGTSRLSARIRVEGQTLHGVRHLSAPFDLPIDVCSGCLISYPLEADDLKQPGFQCASTEQIDEPQPCFPGQDRWVDCRSCAATHAECLSPPD
ncbi:MAG: hypothetical protein HYZ29_05800 [Myxococcales bacterium]|nr:hypothetical protein [Myxococcales bacterium]